MNIFIRLLPLTGAALFALTGCGRKVDVAGQVGELEKAFQAGQSNADVNFAVSAVRTNDYAVSVIALQNARRTPGMTPDQLMAMQRTLEAITADLVARAAKGDANARAALAAIERSRSQ